MRCRPSGAILHLQLCLTAALAGVLAGCIQTERPVTIPRLYAPTPSERLGTEAPSELAPPPGQRVALGLIGEGVQKYECKARDAGFAWVLIGPDARLYNAENKLVGKHYAGPTWEYEDGGKVTGMAIGHIASANPQSVDRLLLRAETHTGDGVFAHVSFIQRLRTSGGAAPSVGCSQAEVGHTTAVEYSAEYVFFVPI